MQVSKRYLFSAAHRILHHKGKCKNLHGHNYLATFIISSTTLTNHMVLDYSDFKKYKDFLDTYFDHALLIDEEDEEMIRIAKKLQTKYFVLKKTTCEEISIFLKLQFPELSQVNIQESETTQCLN